MTLLNGLLSLGALAFTIPLAIHLLFRSRFRTLDWGAMHLLDDVVRINHRRLRFWQWLLLLVRCLIPVLLACCLARPVITGFQARPGDFPQTLVLAIDDSLSMSAVAGGTPRIVQAKQAATELLADLSRRDEVILLRSSQRGQAPPAAGKFAAASRLAALEARSGPVDLAALIQQAISAADTASNADRRIVVVSDFQSGDLNDGALESLRAVGELTDLSSAAPLALLNLGKNSDRLDNVSVDTIAHDSPAVVLQQPTPFTANIRNASDLPMPALTVSWSIGERVIHSEDVSIEPRSTLAVRHKVEFPRIGVQALGVSITAEDAISSDNRRTVGVNVIEQARVLIVDGDPSDAPMEGESDFLVVALSPFADQIGPRADAIHSTVTSAAGIETALRQSNPHVVVLANVKTLADTARRLIVDFVDRGGSMVFFDGDRVSPDHYNRRLDDPQTTWLLPASLGAIVTNPPPEAAAAPLTALINPAFGPWQALAESGNAGRLGFGIDVYRSIKIQPGIRAATILNTSDRHPLAVIADRNRGRVVQFAIACDADWSDLPVRPIFVPAMQQLMLYLAGSQTEATLMIGQPVSIPVSDVIGGQDPQQFRFAVQQPDGSSSSLTVTAADAAALVEFQPAVPGIFRIRAEPKSERPADPPLEVTRVIDIPAAESTLRDAEADRLQVAAASVGAQVFDDVASLQGAADTARHGREIWRWLLLLFLLAAIGELVLQQRLGRGAPSRSSVGTASPNDRPGDGALGEIA